MKTLWPSREEIEQLWQAGYGGKREIQRELIRRNAKVAAEALPDEDPHKPILLALLALIKLIHT